MDTQQKGSSGIIADALPPVDIRDAPKVLPDQAVAGVGQPAFAVPTSGNRFAGFGLRFSAALLDGGIFAIVGVVLSVIFTVGSATLFTGGPDLQASYLSSNPTSVIYATIAAYILQIIVQIAIGFYYFVIHQHKNGQTFGKKRMGIKVIDIETGETPSMGKLALRETIGKWVSFITIIGLYMPLWDEKKQALHDKIAGTAVVKV